MDAAVAQIVNITSASPERAAQYLQLADGDLDAAVMLYFENNGADPSGGPSSSYSAPPPPPASSRPGATGDAQNPIDIDDGTISDDNDPEITGFRKAGASEGQPQPQSIGATFDSDAEYARRLQEEMYGGAGGQGPTGEEEVRAPIARQSETLLGPGADVGPLNDRDIPAHVMEQMQRMQNRRAPQRECYFSLRSADNLTMTARPGIFNQRPATSAIWNDRDDGDPESGLLAESTGGASETSSRSNMLAKMFQPPWELMYKGGWDSAREVGREEQKWLLVNIQDGSVFDCQVLNRDLWKNPSVVETVKENFIFLQYSKDDIRADQYLQYYFQEHSNPDLYPHIAIVDPRTGEQVKVWSAEVPKPGDFLMQLHEFLDRYSLSSHARNPVAKRKSEVKKPKSIDQMTEEEQLERALQASLAADPETAGRFKVEDPDDLTRSVGDAPDTDVMSIVENGHESPSPPSPFQLIPSDRPHVEPPTGSDVTRIQFRHPAGRIIRRFAVSDPVRRIFEWLKAEPLEGKEGAVFELVSMGKNLMEVADQSIEGAGLKNGTVMIEVLEGS
jgi:UBX domain-containing protein 7